jgi:hypothetical protein
MRTQWTRTGGGIEGRDLEALEKVAIGEPVAIDTLFWVGLFFAEATKGALSGGE